MKWFELILYVLKSCTYLGVFVYAIFSMYAPKYLDLHLTLSIAVIAGFLELIHNIVGAAKLSKFTDENDEIKKKIKKEVVEEVMQQLQEENKKNKDAILKEVSEKLRLKEDGD